MPLTMKDGPHPDLEPLKREIKSAFLAHGPIPKDPLRALAILVEEVGEVAEGVLQLDRPAPPDSGRQRQWLHVVDELNQVAAVAVLWADRIKEEEIGE